MQLTADSRFAIKKSMPGVGDGLYAVRSINTGEFILEYTGERVPTKNTEGRRSRYLFEIDDRWTVDGSVPENTAGYINHACEPNTEAVIEDGRINIYAKRDIGAGDELTIDYGEEYFEEFIAPMGCKCNNCLAL